MLSERRAPDTRRAVTGGLRQCLSTGNYAKFGHSRSDDVGVDKSPKNLISMGQTVRAYVQRSAEKKTELIVSRLSLSLKVIESETGTYDLLLLIWSVVTTDLARAVFEKNEHFGLKSRSFTARCYD